MYRGRFAPSPTGPLHMGSLLAALASFLDARVHRGQWLVRVEDLDPAREKPEAADGILASLRAHGMQADGVIRYQSQSLCRYMQALLELRARGQIYGCDCSAQKIRHWRQQQDACACRNRDLSCTGFKIGEMAWRLRVDANSSIQFEDRWQGKVSQNVWKDVGDFALLRRDGLIAYQLAVVIDDALDAISHVVRGGDLLEVTPRQIYLQQQLNLPQPSYLHLPLMRDERGYKLSKQHKSPALNTQSALQNLVQVAQFLGLDISTAATLKDFYRQAIRAWEKLEKLEKLEKREKLR